MLDNKIYEYRKDELIDKINDLINDLIKKNLQLQYKLDKISILIDDCTLINDSLTVDEKLQLAKENDSIITKIYNVIEDVKDTN